MNTKDEKQPVKKVIEIMRSHLVATWAIASCLFALIIHILFEIPAPNEWFEPEWEAGDLLTYASTVALGLLAIWQNQKFKEESDKAQELMDRQNAEAQERMEKLTQQANELSVVSKIIEAETERIKQTNIALDKFYSYCDYQKIGSLYLNKGLNPLQMNAALTDWRSEMMDSFNDVLYQLGRDTCVDIGDIIRHVLRLCAASSNFIDALRKGEAADYSAEMDALAKKQLDYIAARGVYFVETDAQYRRLIFGNMSLSDIRKTYCKIDQRKAMEAVIEDEKNENGVG